MGDGVVHLVGGGPGDPDLITVRGRDLVTAADALVVDALAPQALIDLARPGCEIHHVGKRGGAASTPQSEIDALLVRLAREGKDVVRLKGGDPFVFGRGGEECEALRAAGIRYEVVPGVTSAVAAPALAGIPVTHRDWASHVTLVTARERADGGRATGVDPRSLAALLPSGTLVFLMGARALPDIVAGLLDAGADPATPAAAVMWGSDPRQRSLVTTLGGLDRAVTAAGLGAPLVTVVGRVAALGESLAWLEHPLAGRRVVVTRARAQASGFAQRLRRLGADVVEVPVIAVEPLQERHAVVDAVRRLAAATDAGRWLVFSSANAVRLVLEEVAAAGGDARLFAGMRLVAIGPETAAALGGGGLRADLVPPEYVAESLAEAMVAAGVAGSRVLLPRAAAARDVLPERLREAGADVEVLPIYRAVLPEGSATALREALASAAVDAVTFTSSSTVRHFLEALGEAPFPAGAVAACIGPVTAATAREAGLPVGIVAEEHTTAGLAAALVAGLPPR